MPSITIDFYDYYDALSAKEKLGKLVEEQRKQIATLQAETEMYTSRNSTATEKLIRTHTRLQYYHNKMNRIGECNVNLYREAKALKDENVKLREALEKIAKHDAQHVAITALRGASC